MYDVTGEISEILVLVSSQNQPLIFNFLQKSQFNIQLLSVNVLYVYQKM